jgi:predicted Abi (CAAX) family protease
MIRAGLLVAGRRLRRSVFAWPDAADWRFAAAVGFATLATMALIGFAGGLYRPLAPNYAGPLSLISAAFIPSLGEESIFRGLLMPDRTEPSRPLAAIGGTTALFVIWHGVETLFLPRAAPIFLRPDFLACAACLGAGAAVIRWRTASLWPCVMLHWLAVVAWQTWLGGPTISDLR